MVGQHSRPPHLLIVTASRRLQSELQKNPRQETAGGFSFLIPPLDGRVGAQRRGGVIVPNENARSLRKRLTHQEVKLWVNLRGLKSLGFHFRRQAPIGRYIVDFVSFRERVVIEADGGQHGLQKDVQSDRIRDAFLASQGFTVLRFWNSEIDRNLNAVMERIVEVLKTPTPTGLPPVDPPHKGEG